MQNYSDNNSGGEQPLNFLKSVVDQQGSSSVQPSRNGTGTDSDKENEHRDLITSSSSSSINATKEYSFNLSATDTNSIKQTTMSREESDMWDDFYNEEEFGGGKKVESGSSRENDFDSPRPDRRLDKVEEEEEEDYLEDSKDTGSQAKDNKDGDKYDEERDSSDKNNNSGSSTKKRKKRLFKRRAPPPLSPKSRTLLPVGGSHPNLSDSNSSRYRRNGSVSSTDQTSHLETMSDTSGGERKLLRRKQVSRPRCAGPKPNGDQLQQKYQELEQLMLKPLPNPGVYVQQTRQQMLRLQGLSGHAQSHAHTHAPPSGLPPTGQQSRPVPRDTEKTDRVIQIIDEETNQVYSTMMTVNANRSNKNNNNNRNGVRNNRPTSALPRQRPSSGRKYTSLRPRPQSAGQARPSTAAAGSSDQSSSVLGSVNGSSSSTRVSRGRKPVSKESGRRRNIRSDSSASGGSHRRSDRSESGSKDRDGDYGSSSFEEGTDSRSASRSPGRAIQTTDNHLKNSSNPALRQWLKVKDKEYRKQKREERKKKSRERAEKQDEELRKEEHLKVAEEKVKEWMKEKRKEAWRNAKEERKRRKEEEREIEQQIRHTESLRGKMFTPIKRPAGKYETDNKSPERQQQENNAPTTPQPPKSKFVYKRPVSGRVRLMKLQQERKEDSKKLDEKKKEMDEILKKEKERKMRMSYDQWLLKKREDDYTKRREAAKQRALAKSDPELDRIVPELARKRIENIKRGKKRIDTGDGSINSSVNKSFGGGDFGEEDGGGTERPSYRLEVSGDKKSLKQRPSSAKNTSSSFNPKKSRSPRRPQSANPRVQALMDESQDSSLNPDNSFKLPFPPELGVPKHVAARQEKLFSGQVIGNAVANASSNEGGNQEGVGGNLKIMAGDGGEKEAKSAGNKNHNGAKNGSDEVDTEADLEPQMKSVADSVIASKEEEQVGSDGEDESFFVTHGNLEKGEDNHAGDRDNRQAEGGDANFDEKEDQSKDVVEDNEDDDKSESDDNAPPYSEKEEYEKPEKEQGSNHDESRISDADFFDVDKNERDEDGAVPPLDFDYDDGKEIKYEEEEEEDNDETKDEDEKMEEGEEDPTKIESNLLGNVEQVSESIDLKSSIKHVSFSEEPTIHEDPLAGLSNDIEDDDDNDNDHFYNYRGNSGDTEEKSDPEPVEDFDYDDLDEIEGFKDEDDEAEDERGGYFDGGTPRDDF